MVVSLLEPSYQIYDLKIRTAAGTTFLIYSMSCSCRRWQTGEKHFGGESKVRLEWFVTSLHYPPSVVWSKPTHSIGKYSDVKL